MTLCTSNNPNDWTREIIYNHENLNQIAKLSKKLRILHFNDVYNIENSECEPKAGAARFLTAVETLKEADKQYDMPTLVVFSGDVFSPSARKVFFLFENKE
jgi:hypothetical protein